MTFHSKEYRTIIIIGYNQRSKPEGYTKHFDIELYTRISEVLLNSLYHLMGIFEFTASPILVC